MTFPTKAALAALLLATASAPVLAGAPERVMPGTVSTALNEYNFNVSADGTKMVFARSEAEFQKAHILVAAREGDGWGEPRPIGFTDPRYRDTDPWLAPDGRTLYFVSDRPTASRPDKKDLDLWRAVRTGDGWGAPEHLGDVVNGPGPELGPELIGGVLYFNSARKGGMGELDFYAAVQTGDGFAKPVMLPAPLNSPKSEGDFTLTPDGQTAVFWSSRGGRGHLYAARRQAGGWAEPVRLPDLVNGGPFQFTPQLSADGRTLTYAGTDAREGQPEGMADVYAVPVEALGLGR